MHAPPSSATSRPESRARTLATFGTVRIHELVMPAGAARPSFTPPPGPVGLHHVQSGAVRFETADGEQIFQQGDAFVMASNAVPRCAAIGDLHLLSILVPAQVVEGVGAPAPGEVRAVSSDSALLEPAIDFARRAVAVDVDALTGFSSYYFERLLQEMVIGVLVEGVRTVRVPQDPGLYGSALAVIVAQRSDAALTPGSIARQIRISLRQLQRVFSARGTTVEREIRRARVEHARDLLTDRAYDAMSIDEVGRYSGFAGGSSLARAMAAEGMPSPARLRRSTRGAAGATTIRPAAIHS